MSLMNSLPWQSKTVQSSDEERDEMTIVQRKFVGPHFVAALKRMIVELEGGANGKSALLICLIFTAT